MILEASGVADPEGIVMTFLNPRYEQLLRLDSITCIVDAEAVFAHGDNEALNMLKLRQIGFADMVVLNKADLVGPEHIEVAKEWIDHHIHRIRIIEATRCDVPLEILLAVGRFDPANAVSQPKKDEHHHGHGALGSVFQTWSFESDRPFSLEALRQMVRRELPASIYRCKGIVYAADHPDKRLTLQVVGRRTEIYELDDWGERAPCTQIVAIGESGGIDAKELSNKFDACIEQLST
jgi:G3E family GTPase